MSFAYLPEYAENARLALELANKERAHLAYTHRTLYAQSIDLLWLDHATQMLLATVDAIANYGEDIGLTKNA